eukprot:jgi/Psemu1/55399/gm1.55399_g
MISTEGNSLTLKDSLELQKTKAYLPIDWTEATTQLESYLGWLLKLSQIQRLPHDLGGCSTFNGTIPVDSTKDDLQAWERECHALFAVLASKNILKTDQLRRDIEDLTPDQYSRWSYYGRWSAAMASLLLDQGSICNDDLRGSLFGKDAKKNFSHRSSKFRTGDTVRVKSFQEGVEWRRPHIRTPGYIYGVNGRIVDVCGTFGDPSYLALGLEAPKAWLYRVVRHDFQNVKLLNHEDDGRDCVHENHPHGDHSHDPRSVIEKRAKENEGPPRPGVEFFRSLLQVILDKKLVSREEIRVMIEGLDSAGRNLAGRDLITKAWLDPNFEERLLDDAASAAMELGINTSNPNAPTVLSVVKNTPTEHNLIVCTLCSCYPSGLLGIAPAWYKSSEFRSRAVRQPREVLKEFGTLLPRDTNIRVHDSTADHRYLVLPRKPKGTENWSEEDLKKLVTRDSMLGVTYPSG